MTVALAMAKLKKLASIRRAASEKTEGSTDEGGADDGGSAASASSEDNSEETDRRKIGNASGNTSGTCNCAHISDL